MNLRNIFTTALGCFTILAACGNDNDSNITPTPEPKPDQPTEEAKDVTLYVTNTSRTYDLTKSGLAFGTGSNMSPSTVTLNPATRYQEMDGFGAAITGSTGYNLMQMTQENRTKYVLPSVVPTSHSVNSLAVTKRDLSTLPFRWKTPNM